MLPSMARDGTGFGPSSWLTASSLLGESLGVLEDHRALRVGG